MNSTLDGTQIDSSEQQPINTFAWKYVRRDPRSKVTTESAPHSQKQYDPNPVNDEGTQNDRRELQAQNKLSMTPEMQQSLSNATFNRHRHAAKHESQRFAIDEGTQAYLTKGIEARTE
jgi:hypothetical protein